MSARKDLMILSLIHFKRYFAPNKEAAELTTLIGGNLDTNLLALALLHIKLLEGLLHCVIVSISMERLNSG